jgi:hypothetical protein
MNPQAAIIGRKVRMSTQGDAPNIIAQPTQLISARNLQPRQWVITLAQVTKGEDGTTPWQFAEGNTVGIAGSTAPVIPGPSTPGQALTVDLRWGAGGASFNALFDYPLSGGTFGLTADTLDLNVRFRLQPPAPYAALADVPSVGAFMVPGIETSELPLRWFDNAIGGAAAATPYFFTVKPYARRLLINIIANSAGARLHFLDALGNNITVQPLPGPADFAAVYDVPAQAAYCSIVTGAGAGAAIRLEWQIGLT